MRRSGIPALTKRLTNVPASVRIVGGADDGTAPWIDVTNENITMPGPERWHGGVNGAMLTIRFSIQLDSLAQHRLVAAPATNRIQFRFNGTDGNTNGCRILDVRLEDAGGNNLLNMPRQWADIGQHKMADLAADPADVSAGQVPWSQRGLLMKSAIVTRKPD
jgi:hypothetical protein